MADFRRFSDLSAPTLSELRLNRLFEAVGDPFSRIVMARFLRDPWSPHGCAEYYSHDLGIDVDPLELPRYLVDLRSAGWLHQRAGRLGLLSRLRRDDLELRFPNVMASLREPTKVIRSADADPILHRLRCLSARAWAAES